MRRLCLLLAAAGSVSIAMPSHRRPRVRIAATPWTRRTATASSCCCGPRARRAPSLTNPRDKPKLTIYRAPAASANGAAAVVCPGGGYRTLASDHEGKQVAEWLNSLGVSAFVLTTA